MSKVVPLKKVRTPPHLLQLKVELAGIKPLIWRRVVLPETITLPKLHQVIQIVMGWQDYHLHEFEIAGERYGIPDPDYDFGEPAKNEQCVRLAAALSTASSFRYIYDFGDNWDHRIKVERRLPPDPVFDIALCVAGANAAPPEDVGGAPGYAAFVEAITQPYHPDHQQMLEWFGASFDPTAFDLSATDLPLTRIKL
ncbi:MAG: plasmid pRiA4b ORF-3 family protein [Pseudomonadota bacterium]